MQQQLTMLINSFLLLSSMRCKYDWHMLPSIGAPFHRLNRQKCIFIRSGKKKLQQLSRDQIPWHLRNWRRRWEADVCRDDFLLWNSPGTSSELKPSDVNLLESSMLNTLNYTTYCNPVPFVLNLACTEFSKRNGAKFGKLSMNFPKMADWLCMGWPSCPAALGR